MPEAVPLETPFASLMENSLKLLIHLNPNETENNLKLLGEALPQIKDSLKEIVDVPSKILVATEANNREFLTCELSKSSEGFYRCPWDDKMYSEEGKVQENTNKPLSSQLKQLEKALNEAVSTYASLYYGSDSITSVYIEKESDFGDFFISILIKKMAEVDDEENDFQARAVWDSVHLFEITRTKEIDDEFVYCHTATVMLSFDNSVDQLKNIKLAGNLIRQNESKFSTNQNSSNHLIHVGALVEESESRLRNDLQSVYFGRTHDIVNELRLAMPEGFLRNQADFRDEMKAKLVKRNV